VSSLLARPWDVGALRVHADELQQRGDPLGEFIALSLRAESNVFEREVQRRLGELKALHEPEWSRGLPASSIRPEGTALVKLRRGVPAHLQLHGHPARETVEALVAEHPISQLHADPQGFDAVTLMPQVCARMESLSFSSTRLVASLGGVALPHLRRFSAGSSHDLFAPLELPVGCRLDTLEVKENGLRRVAVEALATDARTEALTSLKLPIANAGPWLPPVLDRWPLRTLGLLFSRASTGEPLSRLATSRLRHTVSSLRLVESADGSASNLSGVEALLSVPWPELRELKLRLRVPIPASLARDAAALTRLESLSFDLSPVSVEAFEALATRELPALRELHLGATRLTTAGLARLLTAPWVRQLEVLDLGRNVLPANAGGLLGAAAWPNLRELSLGLSTLGAVGVDALLEGEFPALQHLQLDIPDGANDRLFARYAELPWLQLTSLMGHSNEHLVAVARAPHAARLRHLTMLNVSLDRPALDALLTSDALQGLVQLTVPDVRAPMLSALRERYGARLVVRPTQYRL
jgi:hypothetical protein